MEVRIKGFLMIMRFCVLDYYYVGLNLKYGGFMWFLRYLMFLWLFIVVVCLDGKMFLYLYYLYVKKILKICEYFCVLLIIIFDRNDILILKVS